MRDFRKLDVWHRSHGLALSVYKATKPFPREEAFGLTSQMPRSGASIPANIAEGCGRDGEAELARFCTIAMGSASELEYHILLAHDLGFLDGSTHVELTQEVWEVKKVLVAFVQRLRANS